MLQKNLGYFRLDPTAMKSVGAPLLSSRGTEPGPQSNSPSAAWLYSYLKETVYGSTHGKIDK